VLFYKAGQFPNANDPEFQLSTHARAVYRSSELPFLLRYLPELNQRFGVPFAFTAFISSYAAHMILILIPLLAIWVPLSRAIPALYVWWVRSRLVYWYQQLKALERELDTRGAKYELTDQQAELERIDGAVRRIRVPAYFSNELYDLRLHINVVRKRLWPRTNLQMAAE
jgi:hypothetical protein